MSPNRLSRLRSARYRAVAVAAACALVSGGLAAAVATPVHAQSACEVDFSANQWGDDNGGFTAEVTITNLGDTTNGWTLQFTLPGGGQFTSGWNAEWSANGSSVTASDLGWNANLGEVTIGFNGSGYGGAPSSFTLNGTACNGNPPPTTTSPPPSSPPPTTANSMGFIGCSMAENVAQGYVDQGGTRMWGPYGTGGQVAQSWTDTNSSAWQNFDQQTDQFGDPTAVWVQICIFADAGATYDEVTQMIENAREHAASGATIYITGQPFYDPGESCFLAGPDGPELTDSLAQQAADDPSQNVIYPGSFILHSDEVSDGCHANAAGELSLGTQALDFWG